MPLNSGFYNTLVDNETKDDLVYLFVGVANFPYLGKIGNLNQTIYSEIENKEKYFVSIIESVFINEYTRIILAISDTWKHSKPSYKWMGYGVGLSFTKELINASYWNPDLTKCHRGYIMNSIL